MHTPSPWRTNFFSLSPSIISLTLSSSSSLVRIQFFMLRFLFHQSIVAHFFFALRLDVSIFILRALKDTWIMEMRLRTSSNTIALNVSKNMTQMTNDDVQRAAKCFRNQITFIYYYMIATVAPHRLTAVCTAHAPIDRGMVTGSSRTTIAQKPILLWYIFPIIICCWKFIDDQKKVHVYALVLSLHIIDSAKLDGETSFPCPVLFILLHRIVLLALDLDHHM